MRVIYLSAHLDDAVLSCGGLIYDQTQKDIPVEIWTVFSGIPNEEQREKCTTRKLEDTEAAMLLKATTVHFDFIDAIYRLTPDFPKLYETVFSPIHPYDQQLISSIALNIKRNLLPDDEVICPLDLGGHVDHAIVRKARENIGFPVTYYIDFPYVDYLPDQLRPATQGFIEHRQKISSDGVAYWLDAACKYKSQDLYSSQIILRARIIEYWAKHRGIILCKREK